MINCLSSFLELYGRRNFENSCLFDSWCIDLCLYLLLSFYNAQINTYLSGEVGRQYVQQYHTGTPETVQKQISEELQTQGCNLRVVICSTSFSKGLWTWHCRKTTLSWLWYPISDTYHMLSRWWELREELKIAWNFIQRIQRVIWDYFLMMIVTRTWEYWTLKTTCDYLSRKSNKMDTIIGYFHICVLSVQPRQKQLCSDTYSWQHHGIWTKRQCMKCHWFLCLGFWGWGEHFCIGLWVFVLCNWCFVPRFSQN